MILALVAAAALSMRVEWMRGGAMQSAEVYGSRAAIWNDQEAVCLTAEELAAVRRAAAGFESFPERIGEFEGEGLKIRGKVTVNGKTVVQYPHGEQSETLGALAATALTTVAKAADARGVRPQDLQDALDKLARGKIPLEALRVTAQSRGEPGWLLQLHGYEAMSRGFVKGGYTDATRSRVDEKELRALVALLSSFPRKVHAPAYTELRVDVLGQAIDVVARPTNTVKSKAFDRVVERLREIATARPAASPPSRR
jgi:hypothetical protein